MLPLLLPLPLLVLLLTHILLVRRIFITVEDTVPILVEGVKNRIHIE